MSEEARVKALEQTVERLERRIGIMEDVQAIRRLQHLYGYLMDMCLYEEVVDLYADDGQVRFFGGVFRGKASVRRLYVERFQKNFTDGVNGPIFGFVLDHSQLQDVVDVAEEDRKTAQARFRCFMQAGRHEAAGGQTRQWWEAGTYENTYVREGGVWKIKDLNYVLQWQADYETGWAHTPPNYVTFFTKTYPQDPLGPDELAPGAVLWPERKFVPFHNPHPVTGRPIAPG